MNNKKLKTYPSKDFNRDVKEHKDDSTWLSTIEEILSYKWGISQKRWIEENRLLPAVVTSMLHYAGYKDTDYYKVKEHPYVNDLDWFNYYHWTLEQENEFRKELLYPFLKKLFPYWSKHKIESESSWFLLGYGLTCAKEEDIEKMRKSNAEKKFEQCKRFNITEEE